MLNVTAKCGACGKSMLFMRRNNKGSRLYYCSTSLHRGACSNRRGVPADLLEEFVKAQIRGFDDEALWHSFQARAQRWNADHALKEGDRDRLERERKRLDTAVERLKTRSSAARTSATGFGSGSASMPTSSRSSPSRS